jgi:Outer membrane protein beta-barrel domain
MKQLILTLAGIICIACAYSQMNISVGPNAGFGHTWMSGSGENRYQPAGNFGVALVYSHNNHVGLGIDLKYSIEGGKKEFTNVDVTSRLNYIRIPVKGIYFFRDYGASFRPKISLGPSFGFLVGGEQEAGSLKIDAKEAYSSFDVGLLGSAGFHYNLVTNTWLHFDLSYYHGLSDISEASETNKNRNIGINLGVAFGIGANSTN